MQAKVLLEKFQSLSPDSSEFEPTIKKLMSELTEHIKKEEEDDLTALERHLPSGESERLATSFQRTKMFVPTRSHPAAPNQPVSVPLCCYLATTPFGPDVIAVRDRCRPPHCSDRQARRYV